MRAPRRGRREALVSDCCRTPSEVQLRIAPSRNNQVRGVNWAEDFAFERLEFPTPGAVAQLGERSDGIRKVRGSIPLGSIRHDSDEAAL